MFVVVLIVSFISSTANGLGGGFSVADPDSPSIMVGIRIPIMVLTLDGNSEHDAQAWGKIGLFGEK